jgi:hypothetical protein
MQVLLDIYFSVFAFLDKGGFVETTLVNFLIQVGSSLNDNTLHASLSVRGECHVR